MAKLLTVATSRFESARQVDILPQGHRCRNLHGHSFQTSVFAKLPRGLANFPGGEVSALRAQIEQAVAPLNYKHLNEVIEQPTDENIARWISQRVSLDDVDRIAVQSTNNQGVDLDSKGMAHVWRRYQFQAAHRLPYVPVGHKCGRLHGHGFEVIVHANQDLGARSLSIDYDRLDMIWAPLQARLNFRHLNEIEGLSNPTSELISSWLWVKLKETIPELSWITVFETGSCGANFNGNDYRIWKDFTLDSAVQLKHAPTGADEKCIHGHTYKLRLHLSAPLDTVLGWTIDFGDVKAIFDPIFKRIDHQPLHELPGIDDADTASVAQWIYNLASADLPQLVCVELYETTGCGSIISDTSDSSQSPLLPV